MKSLWLENQSLSLQEVPLPAKPGEALIKVELSGICGTDLELLRGYYPYTGIPGHEFVGKVIESPDKSWLDQRVVGEINAVCGTCESCKNNRPTHCKNRTVLGIVNRDGVHAEYTSLPLANLHRIPDLVPDEAAVFTEPLAAALEIQQQVHIQPTDRVLLIGAGRLGQLIAQSLALSGCDLCVVARHPRQTELIRQRGIRLITEDELQPQRWDVVVEATGSPSGFGLARRSIRPRGSLILKSTYHGSMMVDFSSLVVDEITIIGSRCGPFLPALRLLEEKLIDPIPLIEKTYFLTQALDGFQDAQKPGKMKILLSMN